MLNARGGIECDLTVARLAEDAYYIVTGTGFATHDFDWIRRNIPARRSTPASSTSPRSTPCLALMGPRARDVLAALTEDDVSNAAFPFGTVPPHLRRRRAGASRCASPTSASSAGSCTSRSSSPPPSTTR